ncbi:MAG: ABC transporter substrate-binding protein [Pseudomonadota bacterium]
MKNFIPIIILIPLLVCNFISCQSCLKEKKHAIIAENPKQVIADAIKFNGSGNKGNTLILPVISGPNTFNPITANDFNSISLLFPMIFQSLVEYNPSTKEIFPHLAKNYELLENGKYIFHLRKGNLWSDGHKITTSDIKFSFELALSKDIPSQISNDIKNNRPNIDIIDDYTISFNFHKTDASTILTIGSIKIIPKHIYNDLYETGNFATALGIDTPCDKIIGSGPYKLSMFIRGEKLVYSRNDNYMKFDNNGKQLPYFDKVIFTIIPDFNTAYLKFLNGELDSLGHIALSNAILLKREQENKNFTLFNIGPALVSNFLWFNLSVNNKNSENYKIKLFKNNKFRKAIAHAIDREALCKNIFESNCILQNQPFEHENKEFSCNNINIYNYSPSKAKAYLKELGFARKNKDQILKDKDGNELKLSIMTNSESRSINSIATMIKSDLEKIGILVHIDTVSYSLFTSRVFNEKKYEAALFSLTAGVPPDPMIAKEFYLSSGRLHLWNHSQKSPETSWEAVIDENMYLMMEKINKDIRKDAWCKIVRTLSEELPVIYLIKPFSFVAAKNSLANFQPVLTNPRDYWNIDELYRKN